MIKNIVLSVLLALVIAVQAVVAVRFSAMPGRLELVHTGSGAEDSIQLEQLRALPERYLASGVKTPALEGPYQVVLADGAYPSLAGLRLAQGQWVTPGQNTAVVSRRLAKDHPVGQTLVLGDAEYQVVGVWERDWALSRLAPDDQDTVFASLGSGLDQPALPVSRVYLTKAQGAPSTLFAIEAQDQLSWLLSEVSYEMRDLTQSGRIIRQFVGLFLFFAELLLVIFLIRLFLKSCRRYRRAYQAELQERYPKEIINERIVEILSAAILWTIVLFVTIFMVQRIVQFQVYVPQAYVPPQFIFDFGFYRELLGAAPSTLPGSAYQVMYQRAFWVMAALLLAQLLLALWLYLRLNRAFLREKPRTRTAKTEKRA